MTYICGINDYYKHDTKFRTKLVLIYCDYYTQVWLFLLSAIVYHSTYIYYSIIFMYLLPHRDEFSFLQWRSALTVFFFRYLTNLSKIYNKENIIIMNISLNPGIKNYLIILHSIINLYNILGKKYDTFFFG